MRAFEQIRETWDHDSLEAVALIDAGDRVVGRHTLAWCGPRA